MSSVTHLTQYLLRLDPSRNTPRTTLYNYLKSFVESATPLTCEVLNDFFCFVLNHNFWQQNTASLGELVHQDLQGFLQENPQILALNEVVFPHLYQLVKLQYVRDAEWLIQQKEEAFKEPKDRLKLIHLSDQQTLTILLKSNGELQVRVYNRWALLRGGKLSLIQPVTNLLYNSRLELAPHFAHWIEGPMSTAARFQIDDQGLSSGVLVRGHTLQRFETLASAPLRQHGELFYGLKRIEKHFINPQSDPYYLELIQHLERTHYALEQRHSDGLKLAQKHLPKAKAALKNIFPNDKRLVVLVTNIEYFLVTDDQRAQWNETNLV